MAYEDTWVGRTAVDRNGDKIGKIDEIYTDDDTGQPQWVSIKTGWFGSNYSLVPMQGVTFQGDDVCVPVDKDTVKNAPNHESGMALNASEERTLYDHYGMSNRYQSFAPPNAAQRRTASDTANSGARVTGTTGSEVTEQGELRLRRITETKNVQVEVPVTEERVEVDPNASRNTKPGTTRTR